MGKYEDSPLVDKTAEHTRLLLKDGTWGTFEDRRREREKDQSDMGALLKYNEHLRKTQEPLKREAPVEKPGMLEKLKNKATKEATDAVRRMGHIKDMASGKLDASSASAKGRDINKKYKSEDKY